jgi:CRP-like cAMP-binding protein
MAVSPIEGFVRRLAAHSALPAKDAAALAALPWRTVSRPRHSYIIREADQPAECTVLVEGFAQRQKLTVDGARQIVNFAVPGDPLDLEFLFVDEADFSVQMSTDGLIARVPIEELKALIETRKPLAQAILASLLADAAIFQEWIMNVGRRDARQRIAHLLCDIFARLEAQGLKGDVTELPYSQDQLADATGLTAVHVNRVLRQLSSEGIISRGRRNIAVDDWILLRHVAGFDRRYLHLPTAA